jgi:diketogulonate reductase-like aldo/keto reductase
MKKIDKIIPIKTLRSGFHLPVYGFGTWGIGGLSEASTATDDQDIETLRAAIDAGVTHFDTAESYGNGHTEELVGEAIQPYERDKLILTSKVSAWNQTYAGVMKASEASLRRLNTSYIDLYLLRRFPEPGIPITETMKAMNELIRQGVVKYIGVSNMTPRRFDEIQRYSTNKIVCNQVHYNLQTREAEMLHVLEHAQASDVMLIAWRPLQKGFLPQTELVDQLAKKYRITPNQIAISWLTSQSNVVTIAKTSNSIHLIENIAASDVRLIFEDIDKIRNEFPAKSSRSDSRPLDYVADIEP